MVRRSLWLAGLVLVVASLAACQITIIPFDPPIAATVTAQDTTDPGALRSSVLISPGEALYYRIVVPVARDLLYGEADGAGLRVRMLDDLGRTLAVSRSSSYFVGSLAALGAEAAGLDAAESPERVGTRSIAVQFTCLGPCVTIAPSTGRDYYLEVRNTSSVTRTFDLYAYTFMANDLNDRGAASNDTSATATAFSATGTLSGAIELLDDVDWFRYTGSATRVLEFSVLDSTLDLRLRFADGTELTGLPGAPTTFLYPGDRFFVYSASGRAGPSGTSGYFIGVQVP